MLTPRGLVSRWLALFSVDFATSMVSAYGASNLVSRLDLDPPALYGPYVSALVLSLICLLTLYFQDLYAISKPRKRSWIVASLLCAGAELGIAAILMVFFTPSFGWTFAFVGIYLAATIPLLLVWRTSANRLFSRHLNSGVLALGFTEDAPFLMEQVQRHAHLGYRFLGFAMADGASRPPVSTNGHGPITFVNTSSLAKYAGQDADLLVVLDDQSASAASKDIVKWRRQGLKVTDFGSFCEELTGKLSIESLGDGSVPVALRSERSRWRDALKRAVDVVAAIVLAIVSLPIVVLTAIAIRLDSPGPIVYSQQRVGRNGRKFRFYKFRSMYHPPGEPNGTPWGARLRPESITRVGRVIRRLRIDEIPQIINVLRGDMSLVGPRPLMVAEAEQLATCLPFFDRRHLVNPGITGWGMVCCGHAATVEENRERLSYDLYYVKNWSLTFDCQIILQTVKVVLLGRGAR